MTQIRVPTTLREAVEALSMAWTLRAMRGVPGPPELWRPVVVASHLLSHVVPLGVLTEHDVADVMVWGFQSKSADAVWKFFEACMSERNADVLSNATPVPPRVKTPRRP